MTLRWTLLAVLLLAAAPLNAKTPARPSHHDGNGLDDQLFGDTQTITAVDKKGAAATPEDAAKRDAALQDIMNVGAQTHNDPNSQLAVGKALVSVKESKRAIPFAENAVDLARQRGDRKTLVAALGVSADAYGKSGDYALATERAKQVLELDPTDSGARFLYSAYKDRSAASADALGPAAPAPTAAAPTPAAAAPLAAPLTAAPSALSPDGISVPQPGSAAYDPIPALNLLRRSPTGREIADFLDTRHIPVHFGDMPEGSAAFYMPANNVIVVPRDFGRQPLVAQAVLLGHEGKHAEQLLLHGSAVCLETELDAGMTHRMIYRELLENGIKPLPPEHYLSQQNMLMNSAIAQDNPAEVYESIGHDYRDNVQISDEERIQHAGPILKSLAKAVIFLVGPYDQPNSRWAVEFKRHWWQSLIAPNEGLAAATREHETEVKEADTWIEKRHPSSR